MTHLHSSRNAERCTDCSAHLTDEQIDDLLIGADVESSHLNNCALCRERVAQLSAPIKDFSALTLAWSERRSATLQPVVAAAVWARPLRWTAASAALLGGALLLSAVHHRSGAVRETSLQTAVSEQPQPARRARVTVAQSEQHIFTSQPLSAARSSAELARDNRMLEDIDEEWDTATPSPADSYELRTTSTGDATPHLAPL